MGSVNMISQTLGAGSGYRSFDDILQHYQSSKEFILLKQVIERYLRGNLPYINDESIVEFPQGGGPSSIHKPLAS
jgi:hypothetical protein